MAELKQIAECQHTLKLTGMYEPFSVACSKCGSLHFSEDDFDAQQNNPPVLLILNPPE